MAECSCTRGWHSEALAPRDMCIMPDDPDAASTSGGTGEGTAGGETTDGASGTDSEPPSPPTPPEDLCASGSFAGGDCKFLINIRCADWRDQADSWNKAKQMEYLYKCMAQDCVQSLEPVDSNREAQTADGIPETPGCRYLDDSPGSGFCYAYNAAQMWCKENPDSEVCQNDPWSSAAARAPLGSEASRQTAWQPGTFPLRGSSASLGTVSCACMKQCACTVGWNKWECRCVDENQEPVGPGSAVPTKIVQDGRKKDECACLCTENGVFEPCPSADACGDRKSVV